MNISFALIVLFFQFQPAKIVRVKDGDTYVFQTNVKTFPGRLANIDSPELKQEYGIKAKRKIAKIIKGKLITYDSLKTDLYGREIVMVRINGLRLDSIALIKGWAWQYYSKDKMLETCQRIAAKKKIGLWRYGNACPPWQFRRYTKKEKTKYCKSWMIKPKKAGKTM